MDKITEEEKKVVHELRKRTIKDVTPKMLEDISLFYRFAKARDFNLEAAEDMLRKHIAWRKEMQIDAILTDYKPPEVLVKYAATSFICFDKTGCVVRLIDCGRTDAKGLWNVVKKTDLEKYAAYILEQDKEMVIKRGGNLGKPMYLAIDDFENLTYANAVSIKTAQYLVHTMKMFIDNFPEVIRSLVIINAPFYFSWIHTILKPVLPNTVLEKVRIYGADGWKEALLEEIAADDLPACYGGKRTDPDGNPLCETIINWGQPIPKSYFNTQKERKKLFIGCDAEELTGMPFSKEEITFEVKEENSYLEFEFETKNREVDFSLTFRGESADGFESVELIPKQSTPVMNMRKDASNVKK
ncbi:SEC14-like protein 2 [Araneus ventricosus]|uniref:SEC14-like protein 2 n=1 Tax=Araneus ventricosus TaxID=182803 RepID=A0A4Y2LXN4_ARAVE|nr:SEC14-like protein 2 [Araneus ventricosus]